MIKTRRSCLPPELVLDGDEKEGTASPSANLIPSEKIKTRRSCLLPQPPLLDEEKKEEVDIPTALIPREKIKTRRSCLLIPASQIKRRESGLPPISQEKGEGKEEEEVEKEEEEKVEKRYIGHKIKVDDISYIVIDDDSDDDEGTEDVVIQEDDCCVVEEGDYHEADDDDDVEIMEISQNISMVDLDATCDSVNISLEDDLLAL
jgi:hypothetical protein